MKTAMSPGQEGQDLQERPLRLLVVEDNPADAELCLRELKRSGLRFEHDIVACRDELAEKLAGTSYDLVLSDYSLPGWTGLGALEELQRTGKDIPFIVVTGSLGEQAAVECIKKGVSDYVLKDRIVRLPVAVGNAVAAWRVREERRRADGALRDSEERFRRLFNESTNAILIHELGPAGPGRIMDVNDTAISLLGYSREELLNMTPTDLAPASLSRDGQAALVEKLQQGQGVVFERPITTKSGLERVLEVHAKPFSWRGGFCVLYEAIDITARKKLEEQFRQAQKMEATGRLAGGIAHDFNNLLGVILGFSDILKDRVRDDDESLKHLAQIRKAGDTAAKLTRQLLAFSRKQVLEPKVLGLNGIVSDVSKMLHRLIGEDVKLITVAAPDLGSVKVDPGQIEQVILNLVVNARDAMPKGGKLTVETANVVLDESYAREHIAVAPGRFVMLAVSDTGIGMDAATRARIFEPFFTTKKTGTGLGLATVYGIVKQSGGNIWVYSEQGKGTTFKIYFPRVDATPEVPGVQVSRGAVTGGTETVLVVEDSESLRTVAREFLERAGYTALEAMDGRDAVRMAEQHRTPIHLLLTDVVMPGMSGPEVAEQVQQYHPETKVLYMSGYADDAIVQHGVLEEGVALLSKPFARESLIRKVRQILDS